MADLTPQQLQNLRQQLNAAWEAAASAQPPAAAPQLQPLPQLPADFCSVYKGLKPILQFAAIFFPGGGAAINAFIAVLDKICP